MNTYEYVSERWSSNLQELLESFEEDPKREADLEKLADAFIDHLQLDQVEFGGWGVDSKRPFGNSDAEGDIAEILDIELPEYGTQEYKDTMSYIVNLWSDLGIFVRYKWLKFRGTIKV